VLKGGSGVHGVIVPSSDPEVRQNMEVVLREIAAYRTAAAALVELSLSTSATGSPVDQQFDDFYEQAQTRLESLTETARSALNGAKVVDAVEAIGTARFLLANGHLYLEELLGGDTSVAIADVQGDFAKAAELAASVAVGTAEIDADTIKRLAALAAERFNHMAAMNTKRETLSGEFERTFKALVEAADRAEDRVHEAMKVGVTTFERTALVGTLVVVVISLVAFLTAYVLYRSLTRAVSRRIGALTQTMLTLARGETTSAIPSLADSDEIGQMAKSVDVFRQYADKIADLDKDRQRLAALSQMQRRELASEFERDVGAAIEIVMQAAAELSQSATTMASVAGTARQRVGDAKGASHRAGEHAEAVAGAAEQIAGSVAEIGSRIVNATRIVEDASNQATRTSNEVAGLASAADRIGSAVTIIRQIAAQTNLLALNATIEAARAGEMGRGFAVVANEVKQLATQTAKATEDISEVVGSIQSSTSGTVEAIEGIAAMVTQIRGIVNDVARAIDEQGAATDTVSGNARSAAGDSRDVDQSIASVAEAAEASAQAAAGIASATADLTRQAETVRLSVRTFVAKVAA
jgi:methyl-accepting chemotaxis protein